MSPILGSVAPLTYSLPFILPTYYIKLQISTGGVRSYLLITFCSAEIAPNYVFNCNHISQCRENGYMSGLGHWVYWPSSKANQPIDRREKQMKTTRIREKIKKFLGDRPRNTAEILEHINSTMRHGTTSQQLGNVLSKDKDIVKVGYIKRSGILSGGYDICEWATRNWVSSNCPEWIEGTAIIIDNNGHITTGSESLNKY